MMCVAYVCVCVCSSRKPANLPYVFVIVDAAVHGRLRLKYNCSTERNNLKLTE